MKHLNQFITEYIIKKKLDKPIDSEDHYEYFPKTKKDLIYNIKNLVKQDIYDFNCIDTSEITDMSNLFNDIPVERNFDISKWNVKNVKDMSGMLNGCNHFNCDLSNWDVSNVENMMGMFSWCKNFEGKGLENWDISNVKRIDMIFNYCVNFDGKSIENWNVSNIQSTRNMFYNCEKLNPDFSKWDVSKVLDMTKMFFHCTSFEGKGLENWDVSKVKYMEQMFFKCENFEGKGLENWNVKKVKTGYMREMFDGCTLLKNKPKWYKK